MSKGNSLMQSNGLVLATYPSCEDCLTWSEDGLAVAGGQNVYVVDRAFNKSQTPSPGYTKWSTTAIRTDQFDQSDWPEQDLATLGHLSVGEEQSESVVVGVSWSPPGLGIHRRSVLAVLTSNLILSIWETDGSQRGWQRTSILNQHLAPYQSNDDLDKRTGSARHQLRIRAFAWSAPLRTPPDTRWGKHMLVVVDDDSNLTCFNISKKANGGYGKWSITRLCTTSLASPAQRPKTFPRMTKLQRTIWERTPVKRIILEPWQTEYDNSHADRLQYVARSSISCMTSQGREARKFTIEVTPASKETNARIIPFPSLSAQDPTQNSQHEKHAHKNLQEFATLYSPVENLQWHEALERVCADFDRQNHLNGLYRVRFWGLAKSPDNQVEAACVTLHPWDTYEYTSAVHEKCHVVLRLLGRPLVQPADHHRSENEVLMSISETIIDLLARQRIRYSTLDCKLLRAYSAWVSLHPEQAETRHRLEEKIRAQQHGPTDTENSADDVQASRAQTLEGLDAELLAQSADLCSICGSQISLTATACESGHPFSRCSLSLLSIQEPGISKQCAMCERQFLDISKLEPQDSQSLSVRLFDALDTCPYCSGKYRG